MQSKLIPAAAFLALMCVLLSSCSKDLERLEIDGPEPRLYSYDGNLEVDECDRNRPIASLAFSEGDQLYLNIVSVEVLRDQSGIDLIPFKEYRALLLSDDGVCFDNVVHELSVEHDFYEIDSAINMYIVSAKMCGSERMRQYVLLPGGQVVEPVAASYDLLLSQCVLSSKVTILDAKN